MINTRAQDIAYTFTLHNILRKVVFVYLPPTPAPVLYEEHWTNVRSFPDRKYTIS